MINAMNKKPLGWFNLPPEVRNMIYTELLTRPNTLWICDSGEGAGDRFKIWDGPLDVSLLRTNKHVHTEAAGILYGENTLSLPKSAQGFQRFLRAIGERNARLITRATLAEPHWADYTVANGSTSVTTPIAVLERRCPGLRELVFEHVACWLAAPAPPAGEIRAARAFRNFDADRRRVASLERLAVRFSPRDYRLYAGEEQPACAGDVEKAKLIGMMDRAGWVAHTTCE